MKHWCNNVDWSLESVFLNINNRVRFKQNWDGDPFLLECQGKHGGRSFIIHLYGRKYFIKWDRFRGKFKKGPPHIGEYNKK